MLSARAHRPLKIRRKGEVRVAMGGQACHFDGLSRYEEQFAYCGRDSLLTRTFCSTIFVFQFLSSASKSQLAETNLLQRSVPTCRHRSELVCYLPVSQSAFPVVRCSVLAAARATASIRGRGTKDSMPIRVGITPGWNAKALTLGFSAIIQYRQGKQQSASCGQAMRRSLVRADGPRTMYSTSRTSACLEMQ